MYKSELFSAFLCTHVHVHVHDFFCICTVATAGYFQKAASSQFQLINQPVYCYIQQLRVTSLLNLICLSYSTQTSLQAATEQSLITQAPSSGQNGHGLFRFTFNKKINAFYFLLNLNKRAICCVTTCTCTCTCTPVIICVNTYKIRGFINF